MKKLFTFFLFIFYTYQTTAKIPYKDSIALDYIWKTFKIALETNDSQTLRRLSLRNVDCDIFQNQDPRIIQSSIISINTFIKQFFQHKKKSKLWNVIENKKYHISVEETDYHPNIYPSKKSITMYTIWFVTWEPNELQKRSEGISHGFEFVKVKGEFKFSGLTHIP